MRTLTFLPHALGWIAILTASALSAAFDPSGILLTWQRDPTTTMTIDWHSIDGIGVKLVETPSPGHRLPTVIPVPAEERKAKLEFRRLGTSTWRTAMGVNLPFPFKEDRTGSLHRDGYSHSFPPSERTIHRLELTGLSPDTEYEVRFDPAGRIYRFRTMPRRLDREVRIAMGGDIGSGTWMERMNRLAASYDPDFVIWGGDLAYCDGAQQRLGRWYEFFDSVKRSLITEQGRLIPVLVTVGNHEVQGGYFDRIEKATGQPYKGDDEGRRRAAPYFFSFFAMPGQPGYNVLDFGDYLSLILLDSGHLNSAAGAQRAWLERMLEQRRHVPYVFPTYHVPAFATYRALSERYSAAVREHWVPLFEQHRLPVVFENHDHNYKRTFPIRDMKKDPNGVTYLGDGSWGVFVVGIADRENKWFLEKAEPVNYFILARLNGSHADFRALNILGEEIDRHTARPR